MITAVSYLWQGLKLLTSPTLRPFVLMPLLINLVLYSVALGLGFLYLNHLVEQLIPLWLHWLTWLIYPLFFTSFCFIGFFTFSLLANLIAAPRLSIVEPSAKQVWQAELKRLRYSMTHTLPLLILFVIPVMNLIAPLLWLGFSAWYVALEYFAYPQENRGVLFPEQQAHLKTMKLSALSFGGLVTIGQALPIINIVIAPVAVIAATLHVHARTNTV
jgi:CysZ protein